MIELNASVRDTITGFAGIVIGRVEYGTSATQVLIQPKTLKDGDLVKPTWLDEARVAVEQDG